jgi:hypothetical protein
MQFRTIARRLGVVASAMTLLGGVALGSTSANAMSVGTPGVVLAISLAGGHNVEAPLSYEVAPYTNGALVTWNCKVWATPDPASTGIDECSIGGQQAILSPNNMPGAVSVAVGTVFVPDGAEPMACVEGHAQFFENHRPAQRPDGRELCAPLTLITVKTGVV